MSREERWRDYKNGRICRCARTFRSVSLQEVLERETGIPISLHRELRGRKTSTGRRGRTEYTSTERSKEGSRSKSATRGEEEKKAPSDWRKGLKVALAASLPYGGTYPDQREKWFRAHFENPKKSRGSILLGRPGRGGAPHLVDQAPG